DRQSLLSYVNKNQNRSLTRVVSVSRKYEHPIHSHESHQSLAKFVLSHGWHLLFDQQTLPNYQSSLKCPLDSIRECFESFRQSFHQLLPFGHPAYHHISVPYHLIVCSVIDL